MAKRRSKAEKPKRLSNLKVPSILKPFIPYEPYMERIRVGEIDVTFLILVMLLLVSGLVMMYSASYAWAIHDGLEADYYFDKQLKMAAGGLFFLLIASSPIFDYHMLRNPLFTAGLFGVSCILMLAVHIPGVGITDGGATRWIDVGDIFSFQPSEIMKLSLVILFAHLMSRKEKDMNTFKEGMLPYLIILGVISVLALIQPHISATAIMLAIGLTLMIVGGSNRWHLIVLVIIGIVAFTAMVYIMYLMGYDYINNRIQSWLYTFEDRNKDIAWQTRNSLIAIGSGGVFGLGLGNSRQKFLYLPESQNDFVFAIVCEELGFIGAAVVILLFLCLILRGFAIAENAPDKFGMLLVTGISIQIGIQALMNIAVVSNSMPNTGISLPFFSYGGTALILQLTEMGIVLNVSRQSIPRKAKADSDDAISDAEQAAVKNAKNQLSRQANNIKMRRTHKD